MLVAFAALSGVVAACGTTPAPISGRTPRAPSTATGSARPSATPPLATIPPELPTASALPTIAAPTAAPTASPTPAPRTLTWWTAGSDSGWLAAARQAADGLTAAQPNLTVRVQGGYRDYGKIVEGVATGNPPDAFELGDLVAFADRGALRALDAYVNAGGRGVDPRNYFDAMWANGVWRGKTYGIPALDHGPQLGLLWNTSLVGSGLPDGARSSLSALYGAGKALTKRDATGQITFLGFDPLDGVAGLLDTARDLVGQDWVDLNARTIRLATPPYESFLGAILGYYNALGVDRVNAFRATNPPLTTSPDSSVNQGREGVVLTGYQSVADVARRSKDRSWTFASDWAPTAGGKVQQLSGRLLGIPAVAKDPDAGWELVRALASDDTSAIFLDRVGTFAATRSFASSDAWKKRPGLQFWIDSLSQAAHLTGRSTNVVSGYAEAKWEDAIADVLAGNHSPHDALLAAQGAIEAELKRFDV